MEPFFASIGYRRLLPGAREMPFSFFLQVFDVDFSGFPETVCREISEVALFF